jgi:hypothetical protein
VRDLEVTSASVTAATEKDEPLFVDDFSDFDMDEILQGTQTETMNGDTQKDNGAAKPVERDDFEDEMDAMNDIDGLF